MQSRKLPKNRIGRLIQFEKPQLNVPLFFCETNPAKIIFHISIVYTRLPK